ncbi:MAG: TonB-dependent receptor domain-containing protein, partial [Pyrinomonadaceae bacterium]
MRSYLQFVLQAVVIVFALSICLTVPSYAQVNTGDITGRVEDQQGRVVPGATVTATNKGTGAARIATTNDAGEYTLAQLPPGKYDLIVEAQNFSKAIAKDFELNVGAKPTLNFELKPGAISETIDVTADAALIETTKSELGGVVSPTEVENLPLINRTFANLSVIMPEARPTGNFDPTKARVGNVAMNGGDGRQLDVNVDGGDNKDNVVGGLLQNFAYEGIQEFQVLQHRWTAESGRSVGGVVNVITKSGSNDFHGSAFINFRNQSLRAKDFFEKQSAGEKSKYDREEYGGSLGGRIIRDKLFFFGTIERFRERQNVLINPAKLPQIAAIPGVTAVSAIPTPYDDTLITGKIDHQISARQSMFYRYAQQKFSSPNDQFDSSLPSDLTGGNTTDNKLYSFVINHTYTLSATKLNQFAFHFQDFTNSILAVTDKPNLIFPSVQTGANVNVPQMTTERKYQFRDDFSWLLNKHSAKFGVNYIHTKIGGFFFFGAKGYQVTFASDPLTLKNSPQGFATPGAVQNITFFDGAGDTAQPPMHQVALYFQDDYKVTPRLTLNLGLRWDANIGVLIDQNNNRTMKLLKQLNHPFAQALAGDAQKLSRTTPSFREFQPRIGFAWDPQGDGRTVVRGGYGIFYDQIFQNLTLFSQQQVNATLYQQILDLGPSDLTAFRFGVDPLPAPPPGTSLTELAPGSVGRIIDPDAKDPYVQKFSFGIEKTLGNGFAISSDYVHTLGIHEPRVQHTNQRLAFCNPAFPGATPTSPLCVSGASSRVLSKAFADAGLGAGRLARILVYGTTNRSLFDSWTTTLRRRARGSLLNASYVLSSSRSWGGQPVASYSSSNINVTRERQFLPEEFGPTRIDERHRVVISGVFDLPGGFQLAPIVQLASARPYSLVTGFDIDSDGRSDVDRICASADPMAVFAARGNLTALRALNLLG